MEKKIIQRAAEPRGGDEGSVARPVSQRLTAQRAAEPQGEERGDEGSVEWPVSQRLTVRRAAEPQESGIEAQERTSRRGGE